MGSDFPPRAPGTGSAVREGTQSNVALHRRCSTRGISLMSGCPCEEGVFPPPHPRSFPLVAEVPKSPGTHGHQGSGSVSPRTEPCLRHSWCSLSASCQNLAFNQGLWGQPTVAWDPGFATSQLKQPEPPCRIFSSVGGGQRWLSLGSLGGSGRPRGRTSWGAACLVSAPRHLLPPLWLGTALQALVLPHANPPGAQNQCLLSVTSIMLPPSRQRMAPTSVHSLAQHRRSSAVCRPPLLPTFSLSPSPNQPPPPV